MANGTYGIRKPAYIDDIQGDVDIFYYYRPTRGSEAADFSDFKKVPDTDVPGWLSQGYSGGVELPGMYNLRLPLEYFGKKGIYTIYIKPKEIRTTIKDVSTLTGNYTSIRGIVISSDGMPDDLTGYRVEYIDSDTDKRLSFYRIITSCNKCEPVSQNVAGSAMQKGVRYRFNNSSTLYFCTLTPSTAMSFKSSDLPNIGKTGQDILLINTKFNPVMVEVEMVDHDADTISVMLEGSQIRNLDNGIITTFDEDGNIYHQAAYGNITNPETGLHTDFKIKYEDLLIKNEEDKLEEIKEQINGREI